MGTLDLEYSEAVARAGRCWFDVDRVARDAETTDWKRRARWGQARWRESRGLPIGTHPYRGGAGASEVGSRLELGFARRSGANFISSAALGAARERLANPEPHQTLHEDRLWADLLSSMPLCFNLFGDLATDPEVARRGVASWWPDAPAGDVRVRFEHSPGRRDPELLGNRSAFDVALEIRAGNTRAIVGIETKYHEHALVQAAPRPAALARYVEVTERSGAFVDDWRTKVLGTALQQLWLDHLLVLAMLQHPSKTWGWGRFVLVYPRGNPSFARAAEGYRALLRDPTTFDARTLEELLVQAPHGDQDLRALHERYLRSDRGRRRDVSGWSMAGMRRASSLATGRSGA